MDKNAPRNSIIISPIGNRDAGIIKRISKEVRDKFDCLIHINSLLDDVSFSFDPARDQYYSTLILEKLENLAPPETLKIIAITDVDLFIPILTYVYGEAQLSGKACIVSTHRLNEGISVAVAKETYASRIVKEVIHELGHTFGLRHCPDESCIMHYCRSVEDVDNKSNQLCRYCTVLLEDEKERLKIL